MRQEMIYGSPPSFETMLLKVKEAEDYFNQR